MASAETDRLPIVAVQLGMTAHAFLQDGLPPVLVAASEYLGPQIAEVRRPQVDNRAAYQRFLLAHHWRPYEYGAQPATEHNWTMSVIVNPTDAQVMVLHDGIPLLFSGPLFKGIHEQEKAWLAAASAWGSALVFYCVDPGPLPDSAEFQRRLDAARAYVIQVPVGITPGPAQH